MPLEITRALSPVGAVTLSPGSGSLSAGTYVIGVVPLSVSGVEGQFDPLGYVQANTITVDANSSITVSWAQPLGRVGSGYRVYIWSAATGGNYYQRYYTVSSWMTTTLTISANTIAGPVGTLTISPKTTGGSLRRGWYWLDVRAVFSDGETIDQSANGNRTAFQIAVGNHGSVAVSWPAVAHANFYKVYLDSMTTGTSRTHMLYTTTPSTSIILTGEEPYSPDPAGMIGDVEEDYSAAGIFSQIVTTSNAKSFFGADVQITAQPGGNNDASYQANKHSLSDNTFAGLDLRVEGSMYWRFGINGPTTDLVLSNRGIIVLAVTDTTQGIGTLTINGAINPAGSRTTQSAITVGTSPFTYTNNDDAAEVVYVFGGAVSNVSVVRNNTTTQLAAASPAQVLLSAGDAVQVTYSSVPTMVKVPI